MPVRIQDRVHLETPSLGPIPGIQRLDRTAITVRPGGMAKEDQVSEHRRRREDLGWVVRVRFAIRLFRVSADHMFPDERAVYRIQIVNRLTGSEINVPSGHGGCRGDQASQAKETRRRRLARREALWW